MLRLLLNGLSCTFATIATPFACYLVPNSITTKPCFLCKFSGIGVAAPKY